MRKEKLNYFDEFVNMSNCIVESVKIFNSILSNYSEEKLLSGMKEIHDYEHKSDENVHKVRRYLVTDFLPPLDREDIALLLHKLDNVEDYLDELIINFKIFNITKIRNNNLEKYFDLLEEASNQLVNVFNNLSNIKNKKLILEEILKINAVEEKADRCFESSMEDLYKSDADAIEIIKWTSVYKGFEATFDAFEGVADCIEDILVKTS